MNREAERKRLVEILKQNCHCINEDCEKCSSNGICFTHREVDHLLDNGIVVPPVKVGDVVYALWETPTLYTETKYVLYSAEVKEVSQCKRNNRLVLIYKLEPTSFRGRIREFFDYDFGKTVFTSREDALKALEGSGEK